MFPPAACPTDFFSFSCFVSTLHVPLEVILSKFNARVADHESDIRHDFWGDPVDSIRICMITVVVSTGTKKYGVGAWECWNVSEKEKVEIGNVYKTY